MKKNEEIPLDLWYAMKQIKNTNWEFQEEMRMKKKPEILLIGIITENFPNFEREMNNQIHKAQRTPTRLNIKRSS